MYTHTHTLHLGYPPRAFTSGFRSSFSPDGRNVSSVTSTRKKKGARSCNNVDFQLRIWKKETRLLSEDRHALVLLTLNSQFFHSSSCSCLRRPAAILHTVSCTHSNWAELVTDDDRTNDDVIMNPRDVLRIPDTSVFDTYTSV